MDVKLSNPRVIVLILTCNGRKLLHDSVSTYLANDYDNFEVVVIDNGSTDGSKEFLEVNFPGLKIIRSETNLGYTAGFNHGMLYAFNEQKADFALITNDDVKVDEHVITEFVKIALTDSQIGFVTGKVYYFDNPNMLQTVGRKSHPILWTGGSLGRNEVDNGQYDFVTERVFCDDIFWLVSRSMYDQIGGYNENFFLQAEDFEWQARAKRNGYKIYYTPFAKLWHKVSMTIGKYSKKKAYYDARNPMLVIMMHQSPEFFKRYFRYFVKKVWKSSLRNLIKLRFTIALYQSRGIFSGIIWGFKNHILTWKHFI